MTATIIEIVPNFLQNTADTDPAGVAAGSCSPAAPVVISFARASAAGEGRPAAVLGAHEQDSERVIDLPSFLRSARSARDDIKPDGAASVITIENKNIAGVER
ncbi:hypothetical protein V1291_000018 [Nitrobacteraceae bacterium AZCC 1564]